MKPIFVRKPGFLSFFLRLLFLGELLLGNLVSLTGEALAAPEGGPAISDVSTNINLYAGSAVPRYSKLEITFRVDAGGANPYLPFDPSPPAGLQPGQGISVQALFTPDSWRTVYTQPAFYYQDFEDAIKNGREWFYPTENYVWKVRFAPPQAGAWKFKLAAQDARGYSESASQEFFVDPSANHGFVRASQRDARYFELEDGTYFPGLGYNMNFDNLAWINPTLDNEANFKAMGENGIQLVRLWLSQWGIYGTSWNPWHSTNPDLLGTYMPAPSLSNDHAYPGSEVSMKIDASNNPCMFIGWLKASPAVRAGATYRVRVRYLAENLGDPAEAGKPYGLVAKVGELPQDDSRACTRPDVGTQVTGYASVTTSDWQILEGQISVGNTNFLPDFYITLENIGQGTAYIDYVWIEEVVGNGEFGANIVSKPWMAHHLYMEQRNSYAFDKVLQLAEQYGVYLRPVLMEKNDWIMNRIDFEGNPIPSDPLCRDEAADNDPARCPGNQWFYGKGRETTKVRWLQQAWWRYVQARWGYSTSIHSWELLNEGDPASKMHYALADEFGKYMHAFAPNYHLVSTSFWHSFPKDAFWKNPEYAHVDFADLHKYVGETEEHFVDTALSTYDLSMQFGANQPGGTGKPVIRGEVGFGEPTARFQNDHQGLWLHNFVWGGINPGGMMESYWYEDDHIYKQRPDKGYEFDHREQYRTYYNFISTLPLNNGYYQDANAQVRGNSLRAWGQKDLINGRAHLWIAHPGHTWLASINGQAPSSVTARVNLSGFRPGTDFRVEWWDPYQPDVSQQIIDTESVTTGSDGTLSLVYEDLAADIAVKIYSYYWLGQRNIYLPLVIP